MYVCVCVCVYHMIYNDFPDLRNWQRMEGRVLVFQKKREKKESDVLEVLYVP